jgi:hypothetical protein
MWPCGLSADPDPDPAVLRASRGATQAAIRGTELKRRGSPHSRVGFRGTHRVSLEAKGRLEGELAFEYCRAKDRRIPDRHTQG